MDWTIILFWTSVLSAGVLVVMMLLSFTFHEFDFHLDSHFDFDHDAAGADHSDSGHSNSLGLIKTSLIFTAIMSWVARVMLIEEVEWWITIPISAVAGIVGVFVFGKFFLFLLRQQEDVSWTYANAIGQVGEVYLTIPEGGEGLIHVNINGSLRTVDAVAYEGSVTTGKKVAVLGVNEQNHLIVTPIHFPNTDGEFERLVKLAELNQVYNEEKIKLN